MAHPTTNMNVALATLPTIDDLLRTAKPGKDWEEAYAYSLDVEQRKADVENIRPRLCRLAAYGNAP
jgi:hypothetical protein